MKRLFFLIAFVGSLLAANLYAAGQEQSNPYIQWFRTSVGTAINVGQVGMTQTAAVIKAAPATGHYRYSIVIRNLDTANTVYLGEASVTSGTGLPLKAGEGISLDRNMAAIYGICGTGLTATVAYFEEAY